MVKPKKQIRKFIIKKKKFDWLDFSITFFISSVVITIASIFMLLPIINVWIREWFNYGEDPFPRMFDQDWYIDEEIEVEEIITTQGKK